MQTNGAVPPWCPLGSFGRPGQPRGGGVSPPPGPRAALGTASEGPLRYPRLHTGVVNVATVPAKKAADLRKLCMHLEPVFQKYYLDLEDDGREISDAEDVGALMIEV